MLVLAGLAADFIVIKQDHDKNFKCARTFREWIDCYFNLIRSSPLMVFGQGTQHHSSIDEGNHLNSLSGI